ncbi:MAG: hypothetical protein ACFCVC_03925 [Acidimicrobiia bacterium]
MSTPDMCHVAAFPDEAVHSAWPHLHGSSGSPMLCLQVGAQWASTVSQLQGG